LTEALKEALPERNHKFIPANLKAIEAGVARINSENA
jgi:2-oxoglutarate ferredoxin oxidoreductase subunit gamma